MASYQQVIELVVKGQEQLAKLERRVKELNKEADRLKTEPAKAGTGALAETIKEAADGQKALNKASKQDLLNRIKLNAAIDLYGRRLQQIQTTAAADQKQFAGRLKEIQAAFQVFKTDKDISGIQAVATELSRILQTSREINRAEVGRNKSIVRRRNYVRQINEFKAAGLDTSKVERFLEQAKVALGTKRFKLAEVLEVKIKERLGILSKEKNLLDANTRAEERRAKAASKAKGQRRQDLALGAGFPLLFGGGAGQVLGGLAGAALGGGFGGQILGAAIGQQIEDATKRTTELGQALQSLDMSALAESTLLVTAELRQAIDASIALGDSQKAVQIAAKETLLQTGLLPQTVDEINNTVQGLSNAWDEVVGAVSGLVATLGTDFIKVLTVSLRIVGAIAKGMNTAISVIREGTKRFILEVVKRIPFIGSALEGVVSKVLNGFGGINEATEERNFNLIQSRKELEKELALDNKLLAIEQRRSAGTDAAAKLNNARSQREKDLLKLRAKTENEIVELRKKFGSRDTEFLKTEYEKTESLIRQQALNEEIRIDKKFALDQEAAAQQREKEIKKELKELEKERLEIRARESKVGQTRIQTQLNELANEEKIFQIRQQTASATIALDRARLDSERSLLQLQESRLQRELDGLQKKEIKFDRQRELVNAIARNRVQQAKIENKVAINQAQQGVRQAELAQTQVKFQVQRIQLELQLQRIKAQGEKDDKIRLAQLRLIDASQRQSAQLTAVMVTEASKQVRIANQIAKEQKKVADNILTGKLESIEAERVEARRAINAKELAKATGQAADEAARLNSNMSSGGASGRTVSTSLPIDPDVQKAVAERAGPFGYRNIYELVEKLEEAQKLKNAREAKTAQMSQPSSSSFASSSSYAPRSSSGGGGGTASVNIKTGPVLEFDGKRYMTMDDFERGVSKLASAQAQRARSFGARRYGGIS